MILHGVPARYEMAIDEPEFNKAESFYIYGDAGSGKTHAACSIINISKINHDGKTDLRLVGVPELVMEYRNVPFENKQGLISMYSQGYLILDDIGAEYQSEFSQEFIYMLIDKRWSMRLWTGFTSNLAINDLPYGDRVKSRIAGMCKGNIHKMSGEDRRL